MSASETAVVITCYELGRTLPEAVESVRSQTAAAEEIVVVDDGSRDPLTVQVVDWLDEHEPDVTVIRSEHRGAAHARNTGVAATTARFVVFLDGDDLFEPTYLEQAADLLRERADLAFVCCALQAFGRASYRWKPPPYTVAEAVGRGACGHISTVFRREVWDQVGGFDEALPAYEDVDFWLRALELGLRGAILDEALLLYRVRHGSRYHGTVVRGEYVRAKEMLLAKHLQEVMPRGEDVLVALLDFQRELTGHARSLATGAGEAEETLAHVETEVAEVRAALDDAGVAPLDWGTLAEPPRVPLFLGHDEIEQHYAERAVKDLHGDDDRSTLVVGPGDEWPGDSRRTYRLVVVAGALEHEPDPVGALTRCRDALKPGGRVVVTTSAMALGAGRERGFTETSLRALLCGVFPPAQVSVTSYGNVLTCLASAAGLVHELDATEVRARDARYPTVVAGSARVPGGGRRRRPDGRRAEAPPRLVAGGDPPRRGAILCYHRIASLLPDIHSLCVPPDVFAAQMRIVAERYEPVALDELAAQVRAGEVRPGAVAVTFDDGYIDNFEVASPILAELGVPATFFVNGPPPEAPREAWWDTLERIFGSDEPLPERLEVEAPGGTLALDTLTSAQRRAALLALHGRLLDAGAEQIDAVAAHVAAWSGLELAVRNTHRLMTAEELVELSARPGHSIGAHGVNHLRLPAHPAEVQAKELADCKADLDRLLERPVTSVAYPYGACDLTTTDIAEEAGFAAGCSVEPEAVTLDSDPLRLPRLEADAGQVETLQLQLDRLTKQPA